MSNDLKALFAAPTPRPSTTREDVAQIEADAALLPDDGPVGQLVRAIDAELRPLVAAGISSHNAVPALAPHGWEAHRLVGSIRGMRAVHWKAAGLDPRHAEIRRDMLDKAWDRIGDERGAWMA